MEAEVTKDFFVSYNKADRAWAEWIAWQLEAEGYSTLLQAWDFRPGSNFILEMDHATKVAKRTIAVLSPDYLNAFYTQPEWAEAFRQDPTGKGGKLLPIQVRSCTLEGLLAPIVYINLVGLNALTAQNELLAGVRRSRAIPSTPPHFPGDASSSSASLSPAFPGSWPLVWNVPYRRNPFFTGREQLLKTVREQLTGTKVVTLTQTLAIHGLGGIGKTQTAVEYAYRYKHQYQAVFWVRAATRDILISDYSTIAELLHLGAQDERDQIRLVQFVKQWFSRQKDWLLILDNADDLEIIPDYLPTGENGHILLTTRDPSVEGIAPGIAVEQLGTQEGIDLLLHRAGLLSPGTQTDRDAAERIVVALGGIPLAISQAATYLKQTQCGLARYLELYQQHRADLLTWKPRVPSDYPRTVAATWSLTFEQVEQRNPAAADLLRLFAFLDPDNIPEDLLQRGASELGPVLQVLVQEDFRLNEAIDLLHSFSLIRRPVESKSWVMHRLVQVVLKDRLDSSTQVQWVKRVVRLVNTAFPEVSKETWEQCKDYLPQVFTCLDHLNEHAVQIPEAGPLFYRAGRYLNDHARYAEAKLLYEKAWQILKEILGPEHSQVISLCYDLSNVYSELGQYKDAKKLCEYSLDLFEQQFGATHPNTVSCYNNLAILFKVLGRPDKAEELYFRCLDTLVRNVAPDYPNMASLLKSLTTSSKEQRRSEEEEKRYIDCSLKEQNEVLKFARVLNNLAVLFVEQFGKYKTARRLFELSLWLQEQSLKHDDPDFALSLNNLATLYIQWGSRYAKAQSSVQCTLYEMANAHYERCKKVLELSGRSECPEMAYPLHGLAILWFERGKQAEAQSSSQQALYQRAESLYHCSKGIWKQHLVAQVAYPLHNLAVLSIEQGRYAEADERKKKYEKAKDWFDHSLSIWEEKLGSEHLHTRTCARNYALLLHYLKRDTEVLELARKYDFPTQRQDEDALVVLPTFRSFRLSVIS